MIIYPFTLAVAISLYVAIRGMKRWPTIRRIIKICLAGLIFYTLCVWLDVLFIHHHVTTYIRPLH